MVRIPKRNSLVKDVYSILCEEIEKNTWGVWLPTERELSRMLQVGRNTLRAALEQLKEEGLLKSNRGEGTRIIRKRLRKSKHKQLIGLLSPEPFDRLRPYLTLLFTELRFMLTEAKINFNIHSGRIFFRKKDPEKVLQKLIETDPVDCWILALSNKSIQQWFFKNRIPCIVAGSPHPGICLPMVDLNHRAVCRHATGKLISLGHKRITILIEKDGTGGMVESAIGFKEAITYSNKSNLEPVALFLELISDRIQWGIERELKKKHPPTAFIVTNSFIYLSLVSILGKYHWRIPDDVSIISTQSDTFLSFLIPIPTTYDCHSYKHAKGIFRMVLKMIDGESIRNSEVRILPEFKGGETIGVPKG